MFKHIPNEIVFTLATNSPDINIFTQNNYNYDLVQKIMVIKPNLFIKAPMYVKGEKEVKEYFTVYAAI